METADNSHKHCKDDYDFIKSTLTSLALCAVITSDLIQRGYSGRPGKLTTNLSLIAKIKKYEVMHPFLHTFSRRDAEVL
jgi:hypothetical protein